TLYCKTYLFLVKNQKAQYNSAKGMKCPPKDFDRTGMPKESRTAFYEGSTKENFFQTLAHRTGSPGISVSDNLCTPFDPRSCDRISDRIFRLETGGPAGAPRRLSDCSCIRRSAFQKRAKKAQDQKIPETSERTGLCGNLIACRTDRAGSRRSPSGSAAVHRPWNLSRRKDFRRQKNLLSGTFQY